MNNQSIELLKVREAAIALRLSLPETYERIRKGRLPSVKIGREEPACHGVQSIR
jgi:excisionase family DNA binding protein